MSTIRDEKATVGMLKKKIKAFAHAREWEQFHTPKNLSMALAAEAAELMEHFLWVDAAESGDRAAEPDRREEIGEELADIIIYAFQFANVTGIDVAAAFEDKMAKNAAKYPVEKSRGRADKYTEL